jgi:hypothetical protein
MKKATRIVAMGLGLLAGFGGPEHGYFEILQGNTQPAGLFIASMGPPCVPEEIWNACEPALTIIPNFLITGIIATILGIVTMIWSATSIHKKLGGPILIALSLCLLLFGGGIFPPVIGIIGGIVATQINVPAKVDRHNKPSAITRLCAQMWPWPLVAFFVWLFGQFVIGYYFNNFLLNSGFLIPGLILGLMFLSIASAFAYDKLATYESS